MEIQKNVRNPNALVYEDLHQLWTQQCEEHELQHGNCTKVFTNSAGRTKNMGIRSSNQRPLQELSPREADYYGKWIKHFGRMSCCLRQRFGQH